MRQHPSARLLTILGTVFVVLFSLGPLLPALLVSLSRTGTLVSFPALSLTLDHYRTVLSSPTLKFGRALGNAVLLSLTASLLAVGTALLGAFALRLLPPRRRPFLLLSVLALSLFPQISIIGALYRAYSNLGLINVLLALAPPYAALFLPLVLWLLHALLQTVPRELDEAARVDGAGDTTILARILVPLSLPGILSAFLLVFVQGFNEFLYALMLLVDPNARTVSVAIAMFEGLHGRIPWGETMAAAVIASLPAVLLALFCQKWIIAGLTKGAVK
ncbi:MAG: carbohydrate ABC transporter permease [Candidatus Hydrogenedentota bacterium]|nr:MAG: carbohydrate ABC transporter permease [Candidatus Hydrogenedentota bacterium]